MLELQCSIARGAGDELSDLDLGLAVRDEGWEAVADELPARLRAVAPTVEVLAHRIAEWGERPHRRIFVQYVDGRQVDLVLQPAGAVAGRVAGAVVLHDPDGRLSEQRTPRVASATADDVRDWEVLGWEALANVAKYLDRGSAWEAHARLGVARDLALRLWAAGEDIPYPVFGLTSLLDAEPPRLPDTLDETVAGLDPSDLRRAALRCADLLRRASAGARDRLDPDALESPMADWVVARLG